MAPNNKSAVVNPKQKPEQEAVPPKKPANGFMKWRSSNYDTLKQKNPDATFKDLNTIIKEEWAKLDPAKKKKMDDEYKDEMAKWKVDNQKFLDQNPESSKKAKSKKDAASEDDSKSKKRMKNDVEKSKKSKKNK